MPIDCIKLGERIKLFRSKKNLSQEELAEKTGNSRVFLGRLERGERTPSLETLISISEALDTSVDSLLGLKSTAGEPQFPDNSLLWDCSEEERDILVRNMKDLKAILRRYRINK